MNPARRILPLLLVISIAIISTGCSGNMTQSGNSELSMASMDGMPSQVKSAPTTVQEAYRFASANPDVLKQIPCYCGCGDLGHTSNYSCYVAGMEDNGAILYDNHALGCSICVDITQDAMRLLREGKTVADIRVYIDQTYSQYGNSNLP